MAIAASEQVLATRSAPAVEEPIRIWNPAHLAAMLVILLSLVFAWWWYQQLEAFASGLDASDPAFDKKWMPVWYANCAFAVLTQVSIPIYFWVTRDRDLLHVTPEVELHRYFMLLALSVTAALGSAIALSFGTADAAWHQVVVRDTSLTPSHIVLFFGIVPLQTAFAMSGFFYALTRIPQFADRLSVGMLLTFCGPFLALPSVAYNEWGHAYWLMEELFIAPLHWGFVVIGLSFVGVFAVILQSMPRWLELLQIVEAKQAAA